LPPGAAVVLPLGAAVVLPLGAAVVLPPGTAVVLPLGAAVVLPPGAVVAVVVCCGAPVDVEGLTVGPFGAFVDRPGTTVVVAGTWVGVWAAVVMTVMRRAAQVKMRCIMG
jgi:hypothetical protein